MRLIYSFCFGDEHYFRMAQEMIRSVRTQGFDEEILILTDRPWAFEGADTRVMDIAANRLWKAAILDAVRAEDYEKILYLDTDIICVKPLDWAFAYEGTAVATGSTLLHSSPGTSHQLSPEQIQAAEVLNIYGINTGAIVFSGGTARDFLTYWEMAWRVRQRSGGNMWASSTRDQLSEEGVLQLRHLRHEVTLEMMLQEKMLFPCLTTVPGYCGQKFSSRTALIHFLSNSTKMHSNEQMLNYMRRCHVAADIESVVTEMSENARRFVATRSPQETGNRLNAVLQDIDNRLARIEKELAYTREPVAEDSLNQ